MNEVKQNLLLMILL